jgi:hypothetical protein
MSGIVGSNLNIKGAGLVAKLGTDGQVLTSSGAGVTVAFEDVAGGISWQAVETGSTMTAVAGEGYPIDTSSNACTITLPASASNGDQIIFTDYARNWGTNGIELDSNGLNYQGEDDTYTVEYGTDGQSVEIVYSGATKGWIPTIDDAVTDVPVLGNSEGIIGYGEAPSYVSTTNLVSNVGVVSSDVTGVGLARNRLGACEYGGDKGIFGFGGVSGAKSAVTNLVSNTGVCSADVTGVGTARDICKACSYGTDKGIFGFGRIEGGAKSALTNLVSNVGVVATDTTGVGTARQALSACEYGTDKGIFAYGNDGSATAVSNLVSNTGVVASDVTGVGTARFDIGACSYGEDKGIFAYGYSGGNQNMSNLVSNVGVIGTDVTGVGTARYGVAGAQYDYDKGILAFGEGSLFSQVNLVSNTGVVASDTDTSATDKGHAAGCSFN